MTPRDESLRDPAVDRRANYDYRGGDDPGTRPPEGGGDVEDLVATLEARVDGEVRFDDYSRTLYATDASAYEVTPVGVVFPTSTGDVVATVEACTERGVAVLPRGGGTSLAGQAVNEAVVLDFTRRMDEVVGMDPGADTDADADADDGSPTATVQPGTILGDLNARLADHGLKFAPDPAWGDKSAIGGAIGNNSTGAHSLQYGKTDAYLESCEVVLADGTVATLGETPIETIREEADPGGEILERVYAEVVRVVDDHADAVREAYPGLKRNVSGYNLDVLVEEAETGSVNLAKLLAGSEGTLGIVTQATVSLEPVPETKAMAVLCYDDLVAAMEDLTSILAHDPAALEVMDDVLLDLARDTREFADLVAMLPEGTETVLLVEFYADSDRAGKRTVAGLLADRCPAAQPEAAPPEGAGTPDQPRRSIAAMEAHAPAERERFWKLRKAGLPILLSRTTDEKHVSFIEDTAVPPERLPEYVRDFRAILDDHDTYASFYAHAGPGVLHVRPLVNTKTEAGVERMHSIADAVTDLVAEYGGSVSGEHGDGRARTEWNRKLYGDEVFDLFVGLKTAFDPDWLLNPGQVCGDVSMTENLRFDPDYDFHPDFDPSLAWENDDGFQGMVELCHGCGGCRGSQELTGGVMCPTYRADEEEILSTRGRANALRQAMSGELPEEELFDDEFFDEVLDLCIGCKGCLRDCPSGVDMAKMKAELTYEHHQREGPSLRDRVFARIHDLSRVGSALAPVSNWLPRVPGGDRLLEDHVGIASERNLPEFERESLADWLDDRGSRVAHDDADHRVLLFPDTDTNYVHPGVGKAAVRALEAANVRVGIPEGTTGSGRPPYSKGFLKLAARRAKTNVEALAPRVERGWDVVVVEPSDAVMIQHDYHDLLSGGAVDRVADATYGVAEYLDRFDLLADVPTTAGERLVYHSHCHQRAIKRESHAPNLLETVGYEVDRVDSGCCGMAGSFGYESEHYSMSRAIASILTDQLRGREGEVVASGTSCRTQLEEFGERDPTHPVEKVEEALRR